MSYCISLQGDSVSLLSHFQHRVTSGRTRATFQRSIIYCNNDVLVCCKSLVSLLHHDATSCNRVTTGWQNVCNTLCARTNVATICCERLVGPRKLSSKGVWTLTINVSFRFLTAPVVLNLLLSLIHAVKLKEGIVIFCLCRYSANAFGGMYKPLCWTSNGLHSTIPTC